MSDGYWAMRNTVGARSGTRDVVRASGADTTTFLQGQLSQDVAALAAGASAMSLLLLPQGKVSAYLRVTRVGDDEFILDVDAGFGETVIKRLSRFLLRTDCKIESLDWQSVSLRGPDAPALADGQPGENQSASVVAASDAWAVPAIDLLGPGVVVPAGVVEVSAGDWTALRIESGVPAMGSELSEDTIPEAAGIVDGSVSFTKGCYTGQELVARVDSRGGNVPQRLRGAIIEVGASASPANVVPPAGTQLVADGAVVATVTSAAWSPSHEAPVALAYVARKIDVPSLLVVETPTESDEEAAAWAGKPVAVQELPLHP